MVIADDIVYRVEVHILGRSADVYNPVHIILGNAPLRSHQLYRSAVDGYALACGAGADADIPLLVFNADETVRIADISQHSHVGNGSIGSRVAGRIFYIYSGTYTLVIVQNGNPAFAFGGCIAVQFNEFGFLV